MSIINNLVRTNSYGDYKVVGKTYIENLSIFKPLIFDGVDEGIEVNYSTHYRRDKGFPRIKEHFHEKNMNLNLIHCKPNLKFLVGYSTLFQLINTNEFKALFIICETNGEITYVVNKETLSMKGISLIIKKFLENPEYKGDVIYTDNADQYCFASNPKVVFKTFKEQRAYYQYIADEWVKENNSKIATDSIRREEILEELDEIDENDYDDELE